MNAVLFDPDRYRSPSDSDRVVRAKRERSRAAALEPVVIGRVWRLAVNGRESPIAHAVVRSEGDRHATRCGRMVVLLTAESGTVAPACARCRA